VEDVLSTTFFVAPEYQQQNLVLLGNLNSNQAMMQLGANFYVYETAYWPGPNGYSLRSVANPFGTTANCIVLAGSDEAGVGQAVDRFIETLPDAAGGVDLVVPHLLEIVVDGKNQEDAPVQDHFDDQARGTYRLAFAVEAYKSQRLDRPARPGPGALGAVPVGEPGPGRGRLRYGVRGARARRGGYGSSG
jgi:hypothetical protein